MTWDALFSPDLAGLMFAQIRQVMQFKLTPGMSIATWLALPFIAMAWLALQTPRRILRFKFRRVFGVLFNWRFFKHRSHLLDVFMAIGNTYVFVLLLGWAIISTNTVATLVHQGLIGTFGAISPTTLDPIVVTLIWTAGIIFAYEFGYWLDHYLAHTVPFLWEFHKVHHAAEALSPLTNFRVHPVDSLVFYNILAITGGLTIGLMKFGFGTTAAEHPIFNFSTYMLIGLHMVGYLQHTQIWIPFTGIWGRIFMSPAHHQIHHSADQKHWDKNMGSFLSVFDWAFGTLYMPSKQREKLTFGVDMSRSTTHSLTEGLLTPFVQSAKRLPQILPCEDAPRPGEAAAKTAG